MKKQEAKQFIRRESAGVPSQSKTTANGKEYSVLHLSP